jgi:2-phosphosulfolactate phosphatase
MVDVRPGDVAVVVDVLSFTTTLTVAVERGITVHPYPWAEADAPSYAAARGAVLAVGRRAGLATGALSLSPHSFMGEGVVKPERVVLPSPNGSAIACGLAESGASVVGACLRNAAAVAGHLAGAESRIMVVAAGERWPDGSLRPAVEDLWGAGAVVSALAERVDRDPSPEAEAAAAAYDAVRGRTQEVLPVCASGRELVEGGFAADVGIAAAEDVSEVVPVLVGDAFVAVS